MDYVSVDDDHPVTCMKNPRVLLFDYFTKDIKAIIKNITIVIFILNNQLNKI